MWKGRKTLFYPTYCGCSFSLPCSLNCTLQLTCLQFPSRPGVQNNTAIMCTLRCNYRPVCLARKGLMVSVGSYMDRAYNIWEDRRWWSNADILFKEGAIKHCWHFLPFFYWFACSGGMYSAPIEGATSLFKVLGGSVGLFSGVRLTKGGCTDGKHAGVAPQLSRCW